MNQHVVSLELANPVPACDGRCELQGKPHSKSPASESREDSDISPKQSARKEELVTDKVADDSLVERERWINQPANEHDEQIRLAERDRCAEIARKFDGGGTDAVSVTAGSIATAIEKGEYAD